MFFYGKNATWNVVADLSELETAVKILLNPGEAGPAKVSLWKDYGLVLAEVMATGGMFHISVPKTGSDSGGKKPLAKATEPYKSKVENALGFFAQLYAQTLDPDRVEVIS